MNIIFVLIPLSLVLLVFAVWAFFWAVRTRQFENLEVEAWRILLEDDSAPPRRGRDGDDAIENEGPAGMSRNGSGDTEDRDDDAHAGESRDGARRP